MNNKIIKLHKSDSISAYSEISIEEYFSFEQTKLQECQFMFSDFIILSNNHNELGSICIKFDFNDDEKATYKVFLYNTGKALGKVEYDGQFGKEKYNAFGFHFFHNGKLVLSLKEDWEVQGQCIYIIEIPLSKLLFEKFLAINFLCLSSHSL